MPSQKFFVVAASVFVFSSTLAGCEAQDSERTPIQTLEVHGDPPFEYVPLFTYDSSDERISIPFYFANTSDKEIAYWIDCYPNSAGWSWRLYDTKTGKIAHDVPHASRAVPTADRFISIPVGGATLVRMEHLIGPHRHGLAPGLYELRIVYDVSERSDLYKYDCPAGHFSRTIAMIEITD